MVEGREAAVIVHSMSWRSPAKLPLEVAPRRPLSYSPIASVAVRVCGHAEKTLGEKSTAKPIWTAKLKEDHAMADPFFEEQPRGVIAAHQLGQDLSLLSVEELSERIELLQAEILRLEAARSAKLDSRRLADSFFKT
jgi:uncharacterized small protein (DUF1192 family)